MRHLFKSRSLTFFVIAAFIVGGFFVANTAKAYTQTDFAAFDGVDIKPVGTNFYTVSSGITATYTSGTGTENDPFKLTLTGNAPIVTPWFWQTETTYNWVTIGIKLPAEFIGTYVHQTGSLRYDDIDNYPNGYYKMGTIGDGSTPLATSGDALGYLDFSFGANREVYVKDELFKLKVIWTEGATPEYFTIDISGLQLDTPTHKFISTVEQLRAAIKNQADSQTWTISAGDYGLNRFSDITVEGETGWYFPITASNLIIEGQENTVIYGNEFSLNGNLSTQNLISVFGNNVTLKGLTLMPKAEGNKTIEVLGEDVKIEDVIIQPNTKINSSVYDGIANLADRAFSKEWGGSIYFSHAGDHSVKDVTINNGGISFRYAPANTHITFDNVNIVNKTANDDVNGYRFSSGFNDVSNSLIGAPKVTYKVDASTNNLVSALTGAKDGDIIEFTSDITIGSQINIDKAVTIDGAGHHLNATFTKTDNSNNSAIGIKHSDVTIQNLVEDGTGSTNLHGINIYESTGVVLDTVTVSNNGHAGIVVNGSTVTATNLNTSNNVWGAVNVDPGSGVITASALTLNSGDLAEANQIWSDGDYVEGDATVTVTASEEYSKYKMGGTTAGFRWTSRALTNVATINGDTATIYTTIQAAVNAAAYGDTINVAAGDYTEQIQVTRKLTINGSKAGISAGVNAGTRGIEESIVNGGFYISTTADGTVVDGFTVQGGYADSGHNNGFTVEPSGIPGITIQNNIIKDVTSPTQSNGIEAGYEANNLIIKNNNISNNWRGIYLNPASDDQILGNVIDSNSGSGVGIGSDGQSSLTISGNTISNQAEGWGSSNVGANVVAHDNIFIGNVASVNWYAGTSNKIDAIQNWWGQAIGPTVGQVSVNVDSDPYYVDAEMKTTNIDVANAALALTNATTAVGTAEGSHLQADVTSAQTLVTALPDGTDKDGLNARLVVVQTEIDDAIAATDAAALALTNATTAVGTAEGSHLQADVTSAQTLVTALPDGTAKTDLQNRINGVSILTPVQQYASETTTTLDSDTTSVVLDTGSGSVENIIIPDTISSTQEITLDMSALLVDSSDSVTLGSKDMTLERQGTNNYSALLPAGTKITGDSSWDGTLMLPMVTTLTSGEGTINVAVKMGSTQRLNFSEAVKITLGGMTGKSALYSDGTGEHTIPACTDASDTSAGSLTSGECSISVGSDLIIWTYHFTTFAAYTPTPTPTPSTGGGGGYVQATCSDVTYGEWGSVFNDLQYRTVLSQTPSNCSLSSSQIAAESRPYVASVEPVSSQITPQTSTTTKQVLGVKKYADGTLLRGSDSKIYVVSGDKLQYIASLKELAKYKGAILRVTDETIASFAKTAVLGAKKYADGTLLKGSNDKIYVVRGNALQYISSLKELAKYKGPILKVDDATISSFSKAAVLGAKKYADGTLIKAKGDAKIYVIKDGKKMHIKSLAELKQYKGKTLTVDAGELNNY